MSGLTPQQSHAGYLVQILIKIYTRMKTESAKIWDQRKLTERYVYLYLDLLLSVFHSGFSVPPFSPVLVYLYLAVPVSVNSLAVSMLSVPRLIFLPKHFKFH